jgi:hypothetical protein
MSRSRPATTRQVKHKAAAPEALQVVCGNEFRYFKAVANGQSDYQTADCGGKPGDLEMVSVQQRKSVSRIYFLQCPCSTLLRRGPDATCIVQISITDANKPFPFYPRFCWPSKS